MLLANVTFCKVSLGKKGGKNMQKGKFRLLAFFLVCVLTFGNSIHSFAASPEEGSETPSLTRGGG